MKGDRARRRIVVPRVYSHANASFGSSLRPNKGHCGNFSDLTALTAREPTILSKSVVPVFSEIHFVIDGEQMDKIEPAPEVFRGQEPGMITRLGLVYILVLGEREGGIP